MTPLNKVVRRIIDIPGEGLYVVSMTREGFTFRKSRTRKEYVLPYGAALLRAAASSVDAVGVITPQKRRRR